MTETPAPPPNVPDDAAMPPVPPASAASAASSAPAEQAAPAAKAAPPAAVPGRWIAAGATVLAAVSAAALVFAWNTQQRVKSLETELVKRQQDSASLSTEARTLARQAEVTAREAAAKMALLEARVAETSMQRSQFEDLIQSLARSRDENVLADVEAAIRVALQQAAITGSAEPLVLTLKQADERLARYNQPRLERVRRAVVQDLERTRSAGVTDITVLNIRLDEVIRQVDDLPLLAAPERRAAATPAATPPRRAGPDSSAPVAPALPASGAGWSEHLAETWRHFGEQVWQEVKGLVRVTRIDNPEAMLVAPEQAFFLRENLKLRLLNARLALLSRQFDAAQSDLRDAQAALDRYFDRSSRRVVAASDTVRQVMAQSRLVTTPRPDATLAAIAAASAGR
ncbi:MAG: uroporphyrinogen-III C-methyltransferase [Rubrivivax sp.]|nr:uroporphyrinogen-III C-methyltransferase [Rubrivivax sp.]